MHGVYVGCLLFADDVALLAASHGELQLMVDVYAEYARRWRFCPNVGKSKTVCFAPAVPPRVPLRLLGEDMEEVDAFKYLGVEFQKDCKWEAVHARLLASSKRAAGYLNALGLGHFHMSPKGGEALWKSLIRPVQDWAADVVPISHRAALRRRGFSSAQLPRRSWVRRRVPPMRLRSARWGGARGPSAGMIFACECSAELR